MTMTLRMRGREVVSDAFWLGLGASLPELVRALAFIILAPLLGPEPYGLLGIAALVVAAARIILRDSWLTPVIRHAADDEASEDTAFWLILALAVAVMPIAVAAAMLVAARLDAPVLLPGICVLLVSEVLAALTVVPRARLLRMRRLHTVGICRLLSVIAGCALALVLALDGYGFWALVWLNAVSTTLEALMLAGAAGWLPLRRYSAGRARPLMRMAARVGLGAGIVLLEQLFTRGMVTSVYGTLALGQYMLARRLFELAVGLSAAAVGRAAFLGFMRHRGASGAATLIPALVVAVAAGCAIGFGLGVVGPLLVARFAGEAWQGAVSLLPPLGLAAVAAPASAVLSQWLLAHDGAALDLRLRLASAATLLLLLVLLLPLGLAGVAWAMAVRGTLMALVRLWLVYGQMRTAPGRRRPANGSGDL